MKRIALGVLALLAVVGGAGAALLATTTTTELITVPYTIAGQTGEVVLTDTDEVQTVTETLPQETVTVTVTAPTTTTDTTPTTTEPPPSGNDLVLPENTTFRCSNYPQPIDFDLVKVNITQQTQRQDAAFIDNGCSGHIGRLEVDTWASDGLHIGAFAHDVTVDGGHIVVHGRCGAACDGLHGDVVQVLGGQRITFNNMLVELQYSEGTNSALYINCGNACQDRPTDVVFDHSTFKRTPDKNRVVRIGNSLRSGIRNSTVYYCGTGSTCDAPTAPAIWFNGLEDNPVNEGNTLILASEG